MTLNKYGLARKPPAALKRKIRQNCGFGCVICGLGIIDYEHVDPEFHEAQTHDPEKMTLLCMQCHGKVSRKMWSKEKVKTAMQDPICKRKGYSNEIFDFGLTPPIIKFAGATLVNCQIPIQVHGESLFEIKPPEEKGAPFRLSGSFCDSQGNISFKIEDNEWFAMTDNWDIETTGPSIIIREHARKIHLKLIAQPPNGIIVDQLEMQLKGVSFIGNKDYLKLIYPDGRQRQLSNCFIVGMPIGLAIGPPSGGVAGFII